MQQILDLSIPTKLHFKLIELAERDGIPLARLVERILADWVSAKELTAVWPPASEKRLKG